MGPSGPPLCLRPTGMPVPEYHTHPGDFAGGVEGLGLGTGYGSPTQRSTTRNSSSGSPNVFSGSSSTLSRLPLEQYSITITFCRLPPCAQDRASFGEEGTSHFRCREVAYPAPSFPGCSFLPGHLAMHHTHLRHWNPRLPFPRNPF